MSQTAEGTKMLHRSANVFGVDGGEHEGEPGRRGGSRLDGLINVVLAEWGCR
jgi:hypothetical protein